MFWDEALRTYANDGGETIERRTWFEFNHYGEPGSALVTPRSRRRVSIPIVAIGGITPENGGVLIEVSADLLVVIEGVFGQPDPKAAARRYTELFRTPIPGVKS